MSSAWRIEYDPAAQKQLKKLDSTAATRIITKLQCDLDRFDDPRDFGEAMIGNSTGFCRYRIGDYRLIARIEDEVVTIYVIEVGHRREVYR